MKVSSIMFIDEKEIPASTRNTGMSVQVANIMAAFKEEPDRKALVLKDEMPKHIRYFLQARLRKLGAKVKVRYVPIKELDGAYRHVVIKLNDKEWQQEQFGSAEVRKKFQRKPMPSTPRASTPPPSVKMSASSKSTGKVVS